MRSATYVDRRRCVGRNGNSASYAAGSAIERRIFEPPSSLHAPHLIDVEIAHVLRRLAARGEIDAVRGNEALIDLADLPIRRYPHDFLLFRVWDLRDNITAYDAVYVALAEALGATLLTRDRRLQSAGGHIVPIELC